MDAIALDLLDKARKAKMTVTRDVLRSFGRSARTTLLADTATSAAVRARVEDLKAGEKWAKNFVKRNNIHSVRLHGEAGSVDKAAIKEGMDKIRALCAKYPARFIFNVDETGLQWKLLRRSFHWRPVSSTLKMNLAGYFAQRALILSMPSLIAALSTLPASPWSRTLWMLLRFTKFFAYFSSALKSSTLALTAAEVAVRAPGQELPLEACVVDVEDEPSRVLRAKGPDFVHALLDSRLVDATSLAMKSHAVDVVALHEVLCPLLVGLAPSPLLLQELRCQPAGLSWRNGRSFEGRR